jgi:hypothetical protein
MPTPNVPHLTILLGHLQHNFSTALSATGNHFAKPTRIDFIACIDEIVVSFVHKREWEDTLLLEIRFVDSGK